MPQIICKERTAHLASYTFFTRDVDQYKNTSLSQLYQPPGTPLSQNTYHKLLSSCKYCKVFKNSFFIEHLQKQSFADVFKISVLKSFANFTGKHLCWSFLLKNLQPDGLQLHKKGLQHRCFSVNFAKFLRIHFHTEHLQCLFLHLRWLLLYFFILNSYFATLL